MDPLFEHYVFDSAKVKMESFMRQLEKSQEPPENWLYTCFRCGSNKIFSIVKQVTSADERTSVFNECRDCPNKCGDGLYSPCDKSPITSCALGFLRYGSSIK